MHRAWVSSSPHFLWVFSESFWARGLCSYSLYGPGMKRHRLSGTNNIELRCKVFQALWPLFGQDRAMQQIEFLCCPVPCAITVLYTLPGSLNTSRHQLDFFQFIKRLYTSICPLGILRPCTGESRRTNPLFHTEILGTRTVNYLTNQNSITRHLVFKQ